MISQLSKMISVFLSPCLRGDNVKAMPSSTKLNEVEAGSGIMTFSNHESPQTSAKKWVVTRIE